jgi:act minimal PKS acyl carrier protein
MAELTGDVLLDLLDNSLRDREPPARTGDALDKRFAELGYDSLTLLNTVRRLERKYRISLPETVVHDARTPRQLLELANSRLS